MSGVRLDLLLTECLGELMKRVPNGAIVWNGGGREVALAKLNELGVTQKPLTLVDVARGCGILGPDPNEIVIENKPKRRRRVSS
jgi:hypothetical protein